MVEWKKLGEVCSNMDSLRKPIKEDYRIKGPYPYYGASGIVDYIDSYIFDGDFLLVSEDGANLTARTSPIAFSIRGKNWVNNHAHVLAFENKITQKLVEVYLNSIDLSPWINGAAQPKLNQANLKTIPIPIPSLSEQQRIVSILDTFTSSISNLKQQIEERRKQYEYERDLLLDLEGKEGVEMKKLGDVCKLERGVRVVKKDLQEEGIIPVYQNSLTPLGYYDKSNYPENTTFVICAGAAGEVGFSNKAFWAADDCTCVVCPDFIHGKFIFHYLMSNQRLLKSQVRKASVPRLSKDVIGKLIVPFPSLEAQSRIVSILDTFEQSIANLEEQLAMREKQYEYYREKLLRFEEA